LPPYDRIIFNLRLAAGAATIFTEVLPMSYYALNNDDRSDPEQNRLSLASQTTSGIKKLSNVVCLMLLTQPLIAIITELSVLGLYLFFGVVVMQRGLSLATLRSYVTLTSVPGVLMTCITYFCYMFIPFILIAFILRADPLKTVPVKRIGDKSIIIPALAFAVIFAFLSDVLTKYLEYFLNFIHLESSSPDFSIPPSPAAFALYFFEICIMAPICEEFIFRGLVLHSLRRYGNGFAILVSALLFSMIHGNLQQIPLAFIVGLLLGAFVIRTGSIWVTVIMHAMINTVSVGVNLLSTYCGDSIANHAYITFVALAALIVLIRYIPGARRHWLRSWLRSLREGALPLGSLMGKFVLTPGFLLFAALTVGEVIMYLKVI
jgi:membrane protease YdiL (CAAX protease family)